jgi:hypothetical protein
MIIFVSVSAGPALATSQQQDQEGGLVLPDLVNIFEKTFSKTT